MDNVTPPLVRQGEIIRELATLIARNMTGNWIEIQYALNMLSRYSEETCYTTSSDGGVIAVTPPDETFELVTELREVMYREGAGTWFSLRCTITKAHGRSDVHFDYNYDRRPDWATEPASSLYTADLIKYPRNSDSILDWLAEEIERARIEYPEEYRMYERDEVERERSADADQDD